MSYKYICSKYEISICTDCVSTFNTEFVGHECHAGSSSVHYKRKIEPPLSTETWYLDRSITSCRITEKPKGNKMSYNYMCSKYEISICTDCVSTFNTMINVQIRAPPQWERTKISVTVKCQALGSTRKPLVLIHKAINFSLHRKLDNS